MSSFTTPLIVEFLGDNQWRVKEEFDYDVGAEGSGKTIHVPEGFITDFASIPQLFWNILPPTGNYGKAAVIHDFLYRNGGRVNGFVFSRKQCDDIFLEGMTVLKVNPFTRWIVYTAVRLFAGFAFKGKL